jgi:hypothetical protein
MEDIYCPNCEGKLNINGNIVFSVKTNDERVGLIFLKNKPGDYHVITHPSFSFKQGELVHFHCPICHKDLMATDVNENLVKVQKTDDEGNTFEVLFSGIAGEHCTYVVKQKQVESYGEDFDKYSSYFHDIVHF